MWPATVAAEPRTYPPTLTVLREPTASGYRVHVARMGRGTIAIDDDREQRAAHEVPIEDELPVAAETGDRVRVVIEYDHARTLLWLRTDDLAWTMLRPVQLAGKGDVGVWLTTGAPVTADRGAVRRAVRYRDRSVSVRGKVAADAIGRVFPATVDVYPRGGAKVRELRARPGGAVIYRGTLDGEVVERRGAWSLVEYRARYVRIRGWARAVEAGFGTLYGGGSGSGHGMSHTRRIEVAAGACLYDRKDGELVGLQLGASERYVAAQVGDWYELYVGSAWGLHRVWARAVVDDAGGPPTWERCDEPPPPAP